MKEKDHKHKYVGGACVVCGVDERFDILDDSEINDEDLKLYKRFGVG